MIKRLLLSAAAAAAVSFGASAETLDILPSCGTGGWGDTSYDAATKTMEFPNGWEGRGWWFNEGQGDFSAYDEFVFKTEETTIAYNIVIQYVGSEDNTSVSVPAGRTGETVTLNPELKGTVQQIYIQAHNPGSIVIKEAYMQNAVAVDPNAPVVLFEGSKVIDWWGNAVDITASDAAKANVAAGDKLVVEYSATPENGFKAIYVDASWGSDVMPFMLKLEGYNAQYQTINLPADKNEIAFVLEQDDVDIMLNTSYNNMKLCGDGVTITKVSIVHAAAQTELSNWYIGGEFNGWQNAAEGFAMSKTATEGVFEFKTAEMAGEFLIVWAEEAGTPDWSKKICGVQNMVAGTVYNYGANSSNFSLAGNLTDVTVTLDVNAGTILVDGTETANEYTDIYLVGDFGEGWNENLTTMPLVLKDGDTYEGTFATTAEKSYFKLKAGKFIYGTGAEDVTVELGKEFATAKSGGAFVLPAGDYKFTYVMAKNADAGKLTVTAGSGIADITADEADAPVEYFNLQGVRVANPAEGGVYIRRQGSKVEKVLVK